MNSYLKNGTTFDRKLAGLNSALDDAVMRDVLSTSLNNGAGSSESTIAKVKHRILKHTPGKRCVIEYSIDSDIAGGKPRKIIGKMYRKNRGEKIFQNMMLLWRASRERNGSDAILGLVEPLGYDSHLGIVFQSLAQGQILSSVSLNDDLSAAMVNVGRNLAILHSLPASQIEQRSMAQHLKKYCHPGPDALIEAYPQFQGVVEYILQGLRTVDGRPDMHVCPVHGDLNLEQIFMTDNQAFFIDFDGCCLTHPEIDIGNFLVVLETHFGSNFRELQKCFVDSYLDCQGFSNLRGLSFYQALAYLRRAMISFRRNVNGDSHIEILQLLENSRSSIMNAESPN